MHCLTGPYENNHLKKSSLWKVDRQMKCKIGKFAKFQKVESQ